MMEGLAAKIGNLGRLIRPAQTNAATASNLIWYFSGLALVLTRSDRSAKTYLLALAAPATVTF
jgi:hypothetical protein